MGERWGRVGYYTGGDLWYGRLEIGKKEAGEGFGCSGVVGLGILSYLYCICWGVV